MMHRTTGAFIIALLFAMSLVPHASAQDATVTITINLETCTVDGSAATTSIAESQEAAKGPGRDCVDGYPAESAAAITIDGEEPTSSSNTSLVWEGIADGEHVADTGATTGGDDSLAFTVAGEDVTLWATYFEFEAGEDVKATEDPDGSDTADDGVAGETATDQAEGEQEAAAEDDDDSTGESGSGATSLPNTGAGGSDTNATYVAGVAVALTVLLLAGLQILRAVRR